MASVAISGVTFRTTMTNAVEEADERGDRQRYEHGFRDVAVRAEHQAGRDDVHQRDHARLAEIDAADQKGKSLAGREHAKEGGHLQDVQHLAELEHGRRDQPGDDEQRHHRKPDRANAVESGCDAHSDAAPRRPFAPSRASRSTTFPQAREAFAPLSLMYYLFMIISYIAGMATARWRRQDEPQESFRGIA